MEQYGIEVQGTDEFLCDQADLTVADYFRRSRLTKPLDVHLVQDVR